MFNILAYVYVFSSNKYVAFYVNTNYFTFYPKSSVKLRDPPSNIYEIFRGFSGLSGVFPHSSPPVSQDGTPGRGMKKRPLRTMRNRRKNSQKKKKSTHFAWLLFQNSIPFLSFAASPFAAGENQIVQIFGNTEVGSYHKSTSFPIVRKKYSMSNFPVQEFLTVFTSIFQKFGRSVSRRQPLLHHRRTVVQFLPKRNESWRNHGNFPSICTFFVYFFSRQQSFSYVIM